MGGETPSSPCSARSSSTSRTLTGTRGGCWAGLSGPRDVAFILTAGADLRWTLEKLSAIAGEALEDQEARSALLAWRKAAEELARRRNKLMHSFYLAPDGNQPLTRMKAGTRGGKWKGESEPVGLDDLGETASMLAEGLEVADRIVELLASCPEWQDPAAPPP
jgi:hypothetical protein